MPLWKRLVYRCLSVFGAGFSDQKLPIRVLLRQIMVQKVLRINSHVPWVVHWTSTVLAVERIQRGTRFPGLSAGCHLDGRNGIVIGENVWIGPGVRLVSMNHRLDNFQEYEQSGPIIIGDNCWLAANVVVLPGVELGNHTIVAAGAVVTKSFLQTDVLIAGVPARVIKTIGSYKG
jgi:acetyltransferase-like isoleucine patch superfamily enzyme